jgi:hypothetical protein
MEEKKKGRSGWIVMTAGRRGGRKGGKERKASPGYEYDGGKRKMIKEPTARRQRRAIGQGAAVVVGWEKVKKDERRRDNE